MNKRKMLFIVFLVMTIFALTSCDVQNMGKCQTLAKNFSQTQLAKDTVNIIDLVAAGELKQASGEEWSGIYKNGGCAMILSRNVSGDKIQSEEYWVDLQTGKISIINQDDARLALFGKDVDQELMIKIP